MFGFKIFEPTLRRRSHQVDATDEPICLLQPRLGAASANGTPTDPCFKGAKQSDDDKDRCEQSCLRNETTAGEQKDDGNPAVGNTAIAVNVLLHAYTDADFNF